MKAAWTLQVFATTFYAVFAFVLYWYIGDGVASPAFSSLPIKWQKAACKSTYTLDSPWFFKLTHNTDGIAIPNFLIAGSLYSHTAAKLLFLRFFRHSRHLHSHTLLGWSTWFLLVFIMNAAAFVLAIGVPIFNYLIGIAASLFASWYTYGLAGAFWLHDAYHDGGGVRAWKKQWVMATLNMLTLLAGAFIMVAGTYVTIKSIVDAYRTGLVGKPFSCSAGG